MKSIFFIVPVVVFILIGMAFYAGIELTTEDLSEKIVDRITYEKLAYEQDITIIFLNEAERAKNRGDSLTQWELADSAQAHLDLLINYRKTLKIR